MKYINSLLLIALLVLQVRPVAAQSCLFERSFERGYYKQANQIISLDSTGWIIAGSAFHCSAAYITRLNCQGDTLWTSHLGGHAFYYDVSLNNNNEIVAVGLNDYVDDVPIGISIITKYDLQGNRTQQWIYGNDSTVFNSQDSPPEWGWLGLSNIAISTGDTMLLSSDSSIIAIAPNGDLVSWSPISHGKVMEIEYMNNSFYVATSRALLQFGSNGSLQNTNTQLSGVTDIAVIGDTALVVITGNTVYQLDALMNTVNQRNLGNSLTKLVSPSKDFIATASQNGTGSDIQIVNFDSGLNSIDTLIIAANCFQTLTSIAANNKVLTVAGNIDFDLAPFAEAVKMFTKSTDYTGNTLAHNFDMGVSQLDLVDLDTTFSHSVQNGSSSFIDLYRMNYNMLVQVTNFTNDTIHNFCINSDIYGGFNCANAYSYNCFDTILAPGDSLILKAGPYYDLQSLSAPIVHTFYTSSPNHKIDSDCSNDDLLYNKAIISSISTPPFPYPLTLSPNPASELINLDLGQTPTAPLNFRLMNITGKLVEETWIKSRRTTLPVAHLLPGLYLYQVIDEQGNTATGKWIKQ